MTLSEIKTFLYEHGSSDVCNRYYFFKERYNVNLELVHQVGGGEGEGEYVERIFKYVSEEDRSDYFFKFTGYYASYSGTSYDEGFTQVFPKEKTITVYEA
jgi:hypothetical protein